MDTLFIGIRSFAMKGNKVKGKFKIEATKAGIDAICWLRKKRELIKPIHLFSLLLKAESSENDSVFSYGHFLFY